MEFGWSLAGTARTHSGADDGWDGVNQRKQLRRVVRVSGRKTHGERDTVPIHYQVVLGAGLATVDRVRSRLLAPLWPARSGYRDWPAPVDGGLVPNQFSSLTCSRCQTPASCQSRGLRQQVVPLPQPSSVGKNRHGHPVRKAKTMPPRAARSGMRGRPPLGLGGTVGSKGSMASQRSLGTSIDAFMTSDHAMAEKVLEHGLGTTFALNGDR